MIIGDFMEIFILCVEIFFARILDVSLGTIRTLFNVKGKSFMAAFVGFIEILIWYLVVKEVLVTDNANFFVVMSYCLGFATGTYIGGILSKKFIKGNLTVQVITNKNFAEELRNDGFAVSVLDVKGKNEDEPRYMLFIEIDNKDLYNLQKLIKELDKNAFIVVNESKLVLNGYMKNRVGK